MLYIEASDETMTKRLLKRGESSGRVDDNEETIKQRLETFHQVTQPVIDHYQDKLKVVNSEQDPNDVFAEIESIIEGIPNKSKPCLLRQACIDVSNQAAYLKDSQKGPRRLSLQLIDETVDKIVKSVVAQAANRQQVKDNVSLSIQNALIDTLVAELEPNEEIGFSFLECENLEIYHGPTKLTDFIDESDLGDENSSSTKQSSGKSGSKRSDGKKAHHIEGDVKHGEIIVIVKRGQKVQVRADENNDTVISNIHLGEVIIRNVDTNLMLNISRSGLKETNDAVELNIVGQAYIKDLSGLIKAKQFKGIVLVKTEHSSA